MIPPAALRKLRRLVPVSDLHTDQSFCERYAADKWFASSLPDAVVLARNAQTVAAVLRFEIGRAHV